MSTQEHPGSRWYIVHAYSGQEDRVKKNLEQRVATMDIENKILQVVIPTEDEVEIKDGRRKSVPRKVFPGYLLVQMKMDDESWYVVRNTPGVTAFVSAEDETDARPKPVPRSCICMPATRRTAARRRIPKFFGNFCRASRTASTL